MSRKRIRRPARGFKPPAPKPPEDPLTVGPHFLAGTIEAVLTATDRKKLANLLIGRRSFTKVFTARDGIGRVVAGSDGVDFWLQLQ